MFRTVLIQSGSAKESKPSEYTSKYSVQAVKTFRQSLLSTGKLFLKYNKNTESMYPEKFCCSESVKKNFINKNQINVNEGTMLNS